MGLLAPLLNACANHMDKYLISKYIQGGGVGALIIFSACFGVIALPFIYFFNPGVLDVTFGEGFWLMVNGSLVVLAILCYLYALNEEEATKVIPYYQTIPIFTFILAYLILGETISVNQLIGATIVFLGTVILSTERGGGGRFSYKKQVAGLMFLAGFCYAVNSVIFKMFALQEGFWISIFWGIAGKVLLGVIFFLFVKQYRKEFLDLIKTNKLFVMSFNSFNEAVTLLAEGIAAYVTLLVPVVLVALVIDAFQPVFVFVIGVLLTMFAPKISEESITKNDLLQKGAAILIILIGGYIIAV
jgi:drug/metabolite transporter (DMT)-like permease